MQRDRIDTLLQQWKAERKDVDVAPMAIIGRVFRLGRLVERDLGPILEKDKLTVPEFDVLAVLRRSGAPHRLPIWKLCDYSLLSSGAMTNRIDRLEKKKLVERKPNPDDRRGVLVGLTAKGKKTIDGILPKRLEQSQEQVSCLSSAEKKQLTGLLRKLLIGMEEEPGQKT